MTDPTLLALFLVATLASGVDAIAGGGGLLTLPALLLAGMDPVAALATNKVQSTAGSTSATIGGGSPSCPAMRMPDRPTPPAPMISSLRPSSRVKRSATFFSALNAVRPEHA